MGGVDSKGVMSAGGMAAAVGHVNALSAAAGADAGTTPRTHIQSKPREAGPQNFDD
jgi:hypothetical protein